MQEIDWQDKAEKLWKLLDDISTASDMYKPSDLNSYKAFYDFAMTKCAERGKYMNSLDGQTLTAVEEEQYQKEVEERYRLLDEYNNLNRLQLNKIIFNQSVNMTKNEKFDYMFKWNQLVTQEIDMWIHINKPVTEEDFQHICNVRGFNQVMINYIEYALAYIGLKKYSGYKLVETKENPK